MDPQVIREETQYIIQDLLRSRNKDDIIREVCWRSKCTWQEGEYMVDRVIRENKKVIQQEKSPLRLLISMLAIAVGLIWVGSVAFRVLPTLVPWLTENGSLAGYALPDSPWVLGGELTVALAMIITGIVLTIQQLKTIRG
jgi:hypothetical protein